MTKSKRSGVNLIQKQQAQLVKIENILKSLLGKVNEGINALKVEELQLKSSAVSKFAKSYVGEAVGDAKTTKDVLTAIYDISNEQFNTNIVNQQHLDLNLLTTELKKNENEYEEEENDQKNEFCLYEK